MDFAIEENEGKYKIKLNRNGMYEVVINCEVNNNNLILSFNNYDKNINRLWIRIKAEDNEYIYGCGEQFSYFNLRGNKFPLFTTEQGLEETKKLYNSFG